ncbi:YdcF family protein [Marinigracilibium pacificum]|uniref:YdcF family protein n=1 Tax=Marinigracilibium pacificum TaxID=2729599 RepID=A0A848J418_9BACT|nr:YdcF family protein [Marinigracilibium pacificum]NMM49270.1 YdcF family protein [Marinigracilibium pacificum]
MPVTIMAIFVVSSFVVKRAKLKKVLIIAFSSLFLIFTNPFLANTTFSAWEIPPVKFSDIEKQYEVGILLTGITQYDTYTEDRVYFNKGADRLLHTVQLYKKGIIKNILISGGAGSLESGKIPEATKLKEVLIYCGIEDSHIYTDTLSANTAENAINSVSFIQKHNIKDSNSILITSAFHMRRAKACFNKAGAPDIAIFPVDYYTGENGWNPDDLIIPSVDSLYLWSKLIKEWVGYLAYSLTGYI